MTTLPIATAPPSGFGRHIKNISHQSSVFLLGTVFSTAAGYFFKIYLARVLGAEALGIYALGMTVVGLAGIVAAVGLPQPPAGSFPFTRPRVSLGGLVAFCGPRRLCWLRPTCWWGFFCWS